MNIHYHFFLNELKKILEEENHRFFQVVYLFQDQDKNHLSMFFNSDKLAALNDKPMLTAMDVLFEEIYRNWRFFDYGVIEGVVERSNSERAKQLVQEYTTKINEELKEYDLTSLYDTTQENICQCDRNTSILKIKCELENIYVEQWNSIKIALHRCFSELPEGTFQFDSTIPGCVTLICKVSKQAKYHLLDIKIKTYQLKPLATMKITSLIIDDEVELQVPSDCYTEVTLSMYQYVVYVLCTVVDDFSRNWGERWQVVWP